MNLKHVFDNLFRGKIWRLFLDLEKLEKEWEVKGF